MTTPTGGMPASPTPSPYIGPTVAQQRRNRFGRIIAALAVVVAIWLLFINDGTQITNASDSETSPTTVTETVTPDAPTTVKADPQACGPDGLPLKFQPEGTLPDWQVLPDLPGSDHAVETDAQVRQALKENPRFLAAFAHRMDTNLWPKAGDWKPLASDDLKCMSERGKQLLHDVGTIFSFQLASVNENGEVPADWTNMGLGPNGPVSNSRSGIEGDRSAIVYTFKDGRQLPVMKRCANLPELVPSHPKVDITTPPPTTKTTTSTTQTTTTPSTSTTTTTPSTSTTTTTTSTTTTSTTTTQTSPPKNQDGGPSTSIVMPPPQETDAETTPPLPPETPMDPAVPTDAPTVAPPVEETPLPPSVPAGLPSETVTTTVVDPGSQG